MHAHIERWGLIGTGALLGVAVGALFFVFPHLVPHHTELVTESDPVREIDTLFAQGQYYFNHDDDPGGVYDLVKARHYYSAVIAVDPHTHPMVWYQLGRIDFLEGKFTDALYKFDRQVEYFGDAVPAVHYMRGLAYGYRARTGASASTRDDWQAAEDAFATFLALVPESPWAHVDLAWVYFAQGKYADMRSLLADGLEAHRENAWYLNMYGLALLNTGDAEGAYTFFTDAGVRAAALSVADWGRAYPGNDPGSWAEGLASMRAAIAENAALALHGGT